MDETLSLEEAWCEACSVHSEPITMDVESRKGLSAIGWSELPVLFNFYACDDKCKLWREKSGKAARFFFFKLCDTGGAEICDNKPLKMKA